MIFNTVHSCGAFCRVDKYIINMNKLNFGFRGFRASFLAHAWQASQESLGQDPSFSIAWTFVLWTVAPLNRDCTLPLRSVSNELMKEMVVVRTTCKTRYNRMHTAPGKHHYTKIAVIIHHLLKLQSHPGDWPFCHWWYEKTEQAFQMLLCHVQVLHVQEWKYVEDGILNVSWRV